MIIKNDKQRIYVDIGSLEAVYPQDSLARFDDDGYYVRTASGEFNVSHEIGEALLDKLEASENREKEILDRIKGLIQPHAHDPDGKCIIEPKRDPGEWLREIEKDLEGKGKRQ